MLLLENRGEAFNLRLEVIEQQAQNVPPDRELGTDRPGRSHSSVGPGRSAMQETDFHEQAEDRFIAEVAGFLGDHSRINGNNVVVIAPPRSEEHTSELQSLMRISYAVFCLKKKKNIQ